MRTKKAILLVEDDQVDVMTMKRALKDVRIENLLEVAGDGEEALALLKDPEIEKPGIILLDLNMPVMNGIEFLKIIKTDYDLQRIPVIVLTTSPEESDRGESFRLSVAGYIIKPVGFDNFVKAISTIDVYWTLSELSYP